MKSSAAKVIEETPAKKAATKKSVAKGKAPKAKKEKKPSQWISKSGTYTSLRHMMEVVLKKKPTTTYEETVALMKKEYPNRLEHWNAKHFAWFRTQIITHKNFKTR